MFNTVPFKSKLKVCCESRFSTRFAILDSILLPKFRNGPISCYDQLTWHCHVLPHLNFCCSSHGYSTVYSRCMLEHTKRRVKFFFLSRHAFMFLYIYHLNLLTFLILKTKMSKKQKYLRSSFQKSQFQSELIYFFKFVHGFVYAAMCVIFVSSLNVLSCNFLSFSQFSGTVPTD